MRFGVRENPGRYDNLDNDNDNDNDNDKRQRQRQRHGNDSKRCATGFLNRIVLRISDPLS
jgi:hypothetical protein